MDVQTFPPPVLTGSGSTGPRSFASQPKAPRGIGRRRARGRVLQGEIP